MQWIHGFKLYQDAEVLVLETLSVQVQTETNVPESKLKPQIRMFVCKVVEEE